METIASHNILSSENQENLLLKNEQNQEHQLNKKLAEYEKFIVEVKSNLSKCKYRRALDEIERKEDLFYDMENWKIKELKILAILKILNKKIYKSESSKNTKLKSIETWLKKIDVIIDNWIFCLITNKNETNNNELIYEDENNNLNNNNDLNINSNNNNNIPKTSLKEPPEKNTQNTQEIQMETILNLILQEFLFIAKHKKQENQLAECSAILALSESLITSFQNYTLNPNFLNTSQEIYLFLSSLLISDNDFQSAKAYQALALKLAFKELFFRIDIESGASAPKNPTAHCFNKVFINIVLAFFQRGVASENLGEMLNAIDAYKQAVWFSRSFIKYQCPEISQFLNDVESRAICFHEIIVNKLQEKNYEFLLAQAASQTHAQHAKENAGIGLLGFRQDLFSKNKENALKQKEKEIEEILNSLNFQEFEFSEDSSKSLKVKNILSTLTLLNNFSSEQFRDLLKEEINVKEINNINEATVEKIQKRLNQIKTEQLYQQREMKKKRENFKALLVNSQLMKESIMKMFNENRNNNINNCQINNQNLNLNLVGGDGKDNKSGININKNDKDGIFDGDCFLSVDYNLNSERRSNGKSRSRSIVSRQSNTGNLNNANSSERKANVIKDEGESKIRSHARHNSFCDLQVKRNNDNNYFKSKTNKNFYNSKAENLNSTFAHTNVLKKDKKILNHNFSKQPVQVNQNNNSINYTPNPKNSKENSSKFKSLSKSPLSFRNMNDVENFLNEKNNSVIKYLDKTIEKSQNENMLKFKNNNNNNNSKKSTNHFRTKSLGISLINNNTNNNQKEKVAKYNHDLYTLSKDYQLKLKNLDDQTKRETEFQKKILKLKRFEKLPAEAEKINNNVNIIKSETEKAFERLIAQNKSFSPLGFSESASKKKRDKSIKDDKKFQNERIKNRLEVSLIKSLDAKALKNWETFMKKSEKTEQKLLRDEFIRKNGQSVLLSVDKSEIVRKINEEKINKIEKDLEIIGKEEVVFKRMLRPQSNKLGIGPNMLRGCIKDFGSTVKLGNMTHSKLGRNVESFVRNIGKVGMSTFESKSDVLGRSSSKK